MMTFGDLVSEIEAKTGEGAFRRSATDLVIFVQNEYGELVGGDDLEMEVNIHTGNVILKI